MTWRSALWEISPHQTTSVKQRNTGEKRQVNSMAHITSKQCVKASFKPNHMTWWPSGFHFCHLSSSPPSQEAMRHLSGLLPEGLKQEIYGLWEVRHCGFVFLVCLLLMNNNWTNRIAHTYLFYLQEYESQSSPEARMVKQFDLLEMILQAHEYEELEGTPGRLQEFFDSTNGKSPIRSFVFYFLSISCLFLPSSLDLFTWCCLHIATRDQIPHVFCIYFFRVYIRTKKIIFKTVI